jgi:hypothetical protein
MSFFGKEGGHGFRCESNLIVDEFPMSCLYFSATSTRA